MLHTTADRDRATRTVRDTVASMAKTMRETAACAASASRDVSPADPAAETPRAAPPIDFANERRESECGMDDGSS